MIVVDFLMVTISAVSVIVISPSQGTGLCPESGRALHMWERTQHFCFSAHWSIASQFSI